MRGVLARFAGAVAAGVAAGLAFPPFSFWWLLPVAVGGLSLAVLGTTPRRGLFLGLLFGLSFLLLLLPWLTVIGPDAWVALSLIEALFYGLLGWGLVRVAGLSWWPVWQACLWVAVETLRGVVPWGGFSWGRLAFASIETPLSPAVTYVGAAGVSFLIALVGTSLAWVTLNRRRSSSVLVVAGLTALVAAPLVLPVWQTDSDATSVRVAVVQGNVPGEGMEAFAERRAVLNNHVHATLDLADHVKAGDAEQPDLVIWPENSTDIDPFRDSTVAADIQSAVDAIGVPVLVGAMVDGTGPHEVQNKGIVWLPGLGPTTSYSKMHPVPFGEYIPMRKFLAKHIKRLDQIPRDMVAGTEPGLLDMDGTIIGDVICFEVTYDGVMRDLVNGGAGMLVVQTNNATYMGTGQVDQQFAIARLRALETRRYVLVAATNGISAIVDPDGHTVARAPKKVQRVLSADVPVLATVTPAVRLGAWIEGGLVALGLLAVAAAFLRGRGRERTPLAETTDESADVEVVSATGPRGDG